MTRPCFARIHLNRLRENYRIIKELAGSGVEIFPVVKANAYGHNSVECGKALLKEGVKTFCVAFANEAMEMIESGISARFILLSGIFPGEERLVVKNQLIPVISDFASCLALSKEAKRQAKDVRVHIKVDTGMGRLGVLADDFPELFSKIKALPGIKIEGILSHLSCADEAGKNKYTKDQIEDFSLIFNALKKSRAGIRYFHLAGSAGIIHYPEARFNSIRPGLILYGADPFYPENVNKLKLKPVMNVISKICLIKTLPAGSRISYGGRSVLQRKSNIGIVPIGYADGLPRSTPPGFKFLVNGKPAPLLGVVTMDFIMLDLTEIPEAKPGNEVLIFGEEDRGRIRVEELARSAHTISYEVFTRIGKRVKREYIK